MSNIAVLPTSQTENSTASSLQCCDIITSN